MSCRYASTHLQRRFGLARTRNIVQFAFNSHHAGGFDIARRDALKLAINRSDIPGAVDQLELLEHHVNGFQVVVRVHVQHGVVLVVKLVVRFDAGVVAFDQVLEIIEVAGGVTVRVHGYKSGVLQKAGVHAPACTREIAWHAINHIIFKP